MRWMKRLDGTNEPLIDRSKKPKTLIHNGKVERSHRNNSKRFYSYLKHNSKDILPFFNKSLFNELSMI
ncbi:hypothetical protein J6Y73_03905 [bacterium]|nr:hypothetical protein [bacterium]